MFSVEGIVGVKVASMEVLDVCEELSVFVKLEG